MKIPVYVCEQVDKMSASIRQWRKNWTG